MEQHVLETTSASPFPFLRRVERLKRDPRRGWEIRGIPSPETIGAHMYRMIIMTMMVRGIDDDTKAHAIKMAAVHDLAEAVVGDIAPADGISKEEKHLRERLGLKYLSCLARPANPEFADEITKLWSEFEEDSSRAAKLVRSIDVMECMDQAVICKKRLRHAARLEEFAELESRVTAPELKDWVGHLAHEGEAVWPHSSPTMPILFVIGGPGVGKGTQCVRLAEVFDGLHISVGDLLREEAKSKTSVFAEFINESMQNSVIIPADLTIRLLRKKVQQAEKQNKRIMIVDGFPRSLDQARAFEEEFDGDYNTVVLQCSEAAMRERLAKRSEASGRIDDNVESITKRLLTFSVENSKVENHLKENGRNFWEINAGGDEQEVHSSIMAKVTKIDLMST